MSTKKTKFTADSTIGEVLQYQPAAADVLHKYFGGGCLGCPAHVHESLAQGAAMHGQDVADILKELNALK